MKNKGFTPHHFFMHYVYFLKSKKYDEIYTGSTNDLRRRLFEHNNGAEISTKRYKPWRLIYYEAYQSEKDAREREKKLKNHGNAIREVKKRAQWSLKNGAGFTLLFSVLIMSIALAITLGFSGFVIRELIVSGLGRESQKALFASDSGMECAIYWDVKYNSFATSTVSNIRCAGSDYAVGGISGVSNFTLNFANGTCAEVLVDKVSAYPDTLIESRGRSPCSSGSPNRVERAFQVRY
ncbi:MAG: hypothetical protein A3A10_02245 [Candidatus Tagabacteria bacterium RIFCSPLOWO2_01_FULL_42_9]|uniref:GIY-YIG domain-containing protein n=1 Tax=Candidatus Tagabacteria bacterium RIFCSPLOWO2_01_FULL_42_9 TaxID=1802296 RepID=A0A1G2LV02_9BACT|nr:MAG: hypothetical protein A3A10_02245 [Candidatus Tagabacteria bacterium RIFCSPLOWO2_01_FULL_42_9]